MWSECDSLLPLLCRLCIVPLCVDSVMLSLWTCVVWPLLDSMNSSNFVDSVVLSLWTCVVWPLLDSMNLSISVDSIWMCPSMDSKNLSISINFCEAGSNISKSGLFLRVLDSMCRTYILSGLSSIVWAYVYFPAGLRIIFINFIYCRGLPWLSQREQRSRTS